MQTSVPQVTGADAPAEIVPATGTSLGEYCSVTWVFCWPVTFVDRLRPLIV